MVFFLQDRPDPPDLDKNSGKNFEDEVVKRSSCAFPAAEGTAREVRSSEERAGVKPSGFLCGRRTGLRR